MQLLNLTENISYIPASEEPFSADVVFIKAEECTWIFDVGTTEEIADYINSIEGPKKVVISHFHPDHTQNLSRIRCDEFFCGKETFKHTGAGTVVDCEFVSGDVKIGPVPNSHAKGSLFLETGNYIFTGDATYAAHRKNKRFYNAQLLKEEISFFEGRSAEFCALSHNPVFIVKRSAVITKLNKIYKMRQGNSPEIPILF